MQEERNKQSKKKPKGEKNTVVKNGLKRVQMAGLESKMDNMALPNQRVGGDPGNEYNVDRGNQTEVLAREKHFHHFLDEQGLRWQKDRNNELFQPTKGPQQLIEQLRKVQGIQLVLFDEDDYKIDTKYKGGIDPPNVIRDVSQRKVPERDVKQDQTVVIRRVSISYALVSL